MTASQARLEVDPDGVEALAHLRREGQYQDAARPDVIPLDLNLPRMDGHEFLERARADESLTLIPVVVLTSSDAEEDIRAAYNNRANVYVQKPIDFQQLTKVVHTIEGFWFTVAKFPPDR